VLFQAIEGLSSLADSLNGNQSLVSYQVLVQCNLNLLSESSKRLFLRLVSDSPHVYHYDWIPQLEILSHRNVVLFVSHGGINGVMEALYHGKPVLGMLATESLMILAFFAFLYLLIS
jgi:UDP:flavonoid glycosyltransferase YjiC (YdhE family)